MLLPIDSSMDSPGKVSEEMLNVGTAMMKSRISGLASRTVSKFGWLCTRISLCKKLSLNSVRKGITMTIFDDMFHSGKRRNSIMNTSNQSEGHTFKMTGDWSKKIGKMFDWTLKSIEILVRQSKLGELIDLFKLQHSKSHDVEIQRIQQAIWCEDCTELELLTPVHTNTEIKP